MAKSAQAFRTIREVADWLGVAAHVLRFWESKFSQIKPVKRAGGRRYYRPSDMELVGGIKVLLHDRGMTIRGVKKMISDEGVAAVAALSPPIDALLEESDVIDITPDQEWDEDMAAEAAALDDAEFDEPLEEMEDEEGDEEAPEPELEPEPEPKPEPDPEPVSEDPPAPDPDIAPDDELPAPDDIAPPTAAAPESPAPAPLPEPSDAALAHLAALARSPSALAPHLPALKALRDRMADTATIA